MKHQLIHHSPNRQKGIAVLIVSIILLVGVSLITIFAARVGMMDQRIAGNEYRHKESKAAADAALEQASAFIQQNPDLYEGTGGDWSDCDTSMALQATFPCRVGTVDYEKVYSTVSGTTISPLAYTTGMSSGVDSDSYLVFITSTSLGNILTAVGRGSSLDGTADAVAQVAFSQVSLLTPGNIPPFVAPSIDISGNFTLVADPNGACQNQGSNKGKCGVPLSAWVHTLDGVSSSSWQTCHLGDYKNGNDICYEEFDETETNNSGWGGCDCDTDTFLSYTDNPSYDLFEDKLNFPPDVFGYVFNGASQAEVKARAEGLGHVYPDCTGLTSVDLAGAPLVWIEGACTVPGDVGTRAAPIILVTEGLLKINSNHNLWGLLLSLADIQLSGGPIIHGSIVSHSNTKISAGGYTQVYDPLVLETLTDPSLNVELSKMKYSWIDFTN